jgi:hypothetical protein
VHTALRVPDCDSGYYLTSVIPVWHWSHFRRACHIVRCDEDDDEARTGEPLTSNRQVPCR